MVLVHVAAFAIPGFQSLLSWIGFKDLGIVFIRLERLSEFQSLLSWIGFKDPTLKPANTSVNSMFQSLLSWIGFKDQPRRKCVDVSAESFNPCCRGLGSKTSTLTGGASVLKVFQSLLSWIGFKDVGKTCVSSSWLARFQSLLSWIGFKDSMHGASNPVVFPSFNPCCRGLGSKTGFRIA